MDTQRSQTDIIGKIFSERGGKEAIQMLGAVGDEWDNLKSKISNSDGFMAGVTAELEMMTKVIPTSVEHDGIQPDCVV